MQKYISQYHPFQALIPFFYNYATVLPNFEIKVSPNIIAHRLPEIRSSLGLGILLQSVI